MGTTVTAILRSRASLALAHIGDSRAYLFRDDELTPITRDHSFVQTLIDEGRITEDEAATHPHRSFVTRVLTGHEGDDPDVVVRTARLGDRYLLCSDGLTGFVAIDTIAEVMAERDEPGVTAQRLVELSLRAGAPDNVTVVIADAVDASDSTPTQPQIVGAASVRRRRGTQPIPITPAQKAAALAAAAHRSDDSDAEDEEDTPPPIQLAEQGPRSPMRSLFVVIGALALLVIASVGGAIAAYQWSQQQFYVGDYQGSVTVFQGVPLSVASLNLSHPKFITEVKVADLPDFQRGKVAENVRFSTEASAHVLVDDLRLRAAECRRQRAAGTPCGTGPDSTPTVTPTPTSTRTPTPPSPAPTTLTPGTTPTGPMATAPRNPTVGPTGGATR